MTPEIVDAFWNALKETSKEELCKSQPEFIANQLTDLLVNRGILPISSKQEAKDYVLSRIPLSHALFC